MMKPIEDFVRRFRTGISLDESLIVKKQGRYYLINDRLRRFVRKDFFYVGTYLGKAKDGIFFPSFILLAMLAKRKSSKMIVDDKAAWLFICGRDIFKRGIQKVPRSMKKGDYALIANRHGECLGFGRVLDNIDEVRDNDKVVVKNISDIGDFLRREK